jgi:hypothetical protein
MQNMQNTQKRCSRCTKHQNIINFGFKKNGDEFKTCVRCRKKNIPEIASVDIPVITPDFIHEKKCNTYDPLTMERLKDIFSNYGFNIIPMTLQIMIDLFYAMDDNSLAIDFTEYLYDNKILGLEESNETVRLLFAPERYDVFHMNLKNTILIDNYIQSIKLNSKKRCGICIEKNRKHYKICNRCNNLYCDTCFIRIKENGLSCPFCRYTLKDHINNNIDKFNGDRSEIFNYIIERPNT